LSVLQAQGSEALDLLGVGDLDVPAFLLERVVDKAGARHRLDHRANGLAVNFGDSPGEGPQSFGVRWRGELIEVVSLVAQKADVDLLSDEIQSGVQH
jgi:hypothetical protein